MKLQQRAQRARAEAQELRRETARRIAEAQHMLEQTAQVDERLEKVLRAGEDRRSRFKSPRR